MFNSITLHSLLISVFNVSCLHFSKLPYYIIYHPYLYLVEFAFPYFFRFHHCHLIIFLDSRYMESRHSGVFLILLFTILELSIKHLELDVASYGFFRGSGYKMLWIWVVIFQSPIMNGVFLLGLVFTLVMYITLLPRYGLQDY